MRGARRHPVIHSLNGHSEPLAKVDHDEVYSFPRGAVEVAEQPLELTRVQKVQARVDGESIMLLKQSGLSTAQAVEVVERTHSETVAKVSSVFDSITESIKAAGGLAE